MAFASEVSVCFVQQFEATLEFAKMLCTWLLSALCWFNVIGHGWHSDHAVQPYAQQPLQNLVTWDEHSLFVRGERIMIFSGEFHPFRLPVPDLWLDIFQKLKSAGFSAVSFYTHWVKGFLMLRCKG